ncbi:MAG: hypothetical protein JWS12_448 [Candidatus Saccharibacteria bacterium]|nr:hypothetical protein [Candidatus Saccharibacteria bacterium]
MPNVSINWLAVLVAAVINMVVGAAWYSPSVFGKTWSKLVGRKMEDMRSNAGPGYAITTVAALVQAYILSLFVGYAGVDTVARGALVGFMLWLGFAAATSISDTVFAGRPWKLWQINTGYYLVVLVVNGALLAVWR